MKPGDDQLDEFEALLEENRGAVERYVRFRVSSIADADDILQETFITAFSRFDRLRRRESFKAWLITRM